MARTRTRSFAQTVSGGYTNGGTSYTNIPATGYTSTCTDETGRESRHALRIVRKETIARPLNGTSGARIFSNYRTTPFDTVGASNTLSLPAFEVGLARLTALARSNPSKAEADLAVSIGELKNAPKAVFDAGQDFVKFLSRKGRKFNPRQRRPLQEGAGGYLGVQFGLLPLVSDVKVILTAQERIQRRLEMLENLRDGDGIRRRVKLDYEQLRQTGVLYESRSGLLISLPRTSYITRRSWATVNWSPTKNWKAPDTDHRRWMEARRAVLGLNIDLVTAWNLMPWSWLIDYFSETGTMLNATRNVVGASPGAVCVMVHTINADIVSDTTRSDVSGGGGIRRTETKERFVSTGFTGLTASLPMLTGKQVSILGALAISRLPK